VIEFSWVTWYRRKPVGRARPFLSLHRVGPLQVIGLTHRETLQGLTLGFLQNAQSQKKNDALVTQEAFTVQSNGEGMFGYSGHVNKCIWHVHIGHDNLVFSTLQNPHNY
jgi:hypothetical protein